MKCRSGHSRHIYTTVSFRALNTSAASERWPRSADEELEYSIGEKLSYAFTVLGAFILSAPFTVILSALLLPVIVCIGLMWLCVDLARAEQSKRPVKTIFDVFSPI